jgi:hypothetical protein
MLGYKALIPPGGQYHTMTQEYVAASTRQFKDIGIKKPEWNAINHVWDGRELVLPNQCSKIQSTCQW